MTDKPKDKTLLPGLLTQNPAPVGGDSQDRKNQVRSQVDNIMAVFFQLLPSNYVSQVQGPFYSMQYQAAAERIAEFQVTAQETFSDADYDFLRGEFLFQVLGSLVFPDAATDGYPILKGDITFRTFLKRMVALLLQGATKLTIEQGLALLSEADFEVIEKVIRARQTKGSAWGLDDQFEYEINVTEISTTTLGPTFPEDPFVLQENVRIVLRALQPAHAIYEYRHLFKETFSNSGILTGEEDEGAQPGVFSDTDGSSWVWSSYYYADFRKFCCGAKEVSGTAGVTWTDKSLFSDSTLDFDNIQAGAVLVVLSGVNGIDAGGIEGTSASTDRGEYGRYRVKDVLSFPIGTDTTARSYTTSGGLSGTATVSGDAVIDSSQDFGTLVEGETLTFTEGPNAGTYRLDALLGSTGGKVGFSSGPATSVRVAKSILRLERRMTVAATGQSYTVVVDRLGVQIPRTVSNEDATLYFVL